VEVQEEQVQRLLEVVELEEVVQVLLLPHQQQHQEQQILVEEVEVVEEII
jgi:pyruvate-formate lyase-activating enzyme